jgi:hypothetical protein
MDLTEYHRDDGRAILGVVRPSPFHPRGADVHTPTLAVRAARVRWRSAEDRLYPALLAAPTSYQRVIRAVQAVVAELRRQASDTAGLVEAERSAEELVATACPDGIGVPADLIVAVACGMLDRELTAEREQRRRKDAMDAARAAGRAWAVVDGPDTVEDLTEGRMVAVHLVSGTVVQATVDPWTRNAAFGLEVTPRGDMQSFADRAVWLAELARLRREIEAAHPADAP